MKYTATLPMGQDGKPLGDPNWFTGYTGVVQTSVTPRAFALSSAYPNPFNPSTNFKFTLANTGLVSLKVYNVLGQAVATIVNNQFYTAGTYSIKVDMLGMSSGVYFGVLEQGNNRSVQKMMLLK
jgi:hypothetical protein